MQECVAYKVASKQFFCFQKNRGLFPSSFHCLISCCDTVEMCFLHTLMKRGTACVTVMYFDRGGFIMLVDFFFSNHIHLSPREDSICESFGLNETKYQFECFTVDESQSQKAESQQPVATHPLPHTRQTQTEIRARKTVYLMFPQTANVFGLLSTGVLHSCGHVVSGLHIWRAPHPETSLPWKIRNWPN